MGTCSETICKHRILFPSIQHCDNQSDHPRLKRVRWHIATDHASHHQRVLCPLHWETATHATQRMQADLVKCWSAPATLQQQMPCRTVVSHPAPSTGLKLHISFCFSCRNEAKASLISPHRRWFSPVLATCSIHCCLSRRDLLLGPARRLYSSTSPLRIACLRWSIIARVAWDIHGFLAHKRLPRTSLAAKSRALL